MSLSSRWLVSALVSSRQILCPRLDRGSVLFHLVANVSSVIENIYWSQNNRNLLLMLGTGVVA